MCTHAEATAGVILGDHDWFLALLACSHIRSYLVVAT